MQCTTIYYSLNNSTPKRPSISRLEISDIKFREIYIPVCHAMDNSAGFLRVFGLIGVGHIKLRNSELFVVRRKPLTESIAPKMAA